MRCKVSNKLIGFSDLSIKGIDEYYRMLNKRIVLDNNKLKGFIKWGYYVW